MILRARRSLISVTGIRMMFTTLVAAVGVVTNIFSLVTFTPFTSVGFVLEKKIEKKESFSTQDEKI